MSDKPKREPPAQIFVWADGKWTNQYYSPAELTLYGPYVPAADNRWEQQARKHWEGRAEKAESTLARLRKIYHQWLKSDVLAPPTDRDTLIKIREVLKEPAQLKAQVCAHGAKAGETCPSECVPPNMIGCECGTRHLGACQLRAGKGDDLVTTCVVCEAKKPLEGTRK